MQRMHQSYKYMRAQQKKLSGCASNLLAHEDLGQFEEAHYWNIQAKFYNEKFPLVYESDKMRDSLSRRSWCYFEAQVWKKDSNIVPSLFFSHFFIWAFSLFYGHFFSSFFIQSRVSSRLVGESQSPSSFPHMGQCSNNEDHHTFIYLQLNAQNKI